MLRLRLVSWNCRMGVDAKRAAFDGLGADRLVIPECPRAPARSRELHSSFEWRGRYDAKGLGVFALGGWRVVPADERQSLPWVLPLRLFDPDGREVALLLAVWTVADPGSPSYTAQVAAVITEWGDEIRSGPTIIAGDFNCSAQSARPTRHLRNLASIERLGAVSAYHQFNGVRHGEEEDMTLRWIGREGKASGFHCDFIFASAALAPRVSSVEVGSFADWIDTGLSDHCPVVAEFDELPH